MNVYSVGYSTNGTWTFLCVRDVSIHAVLDWVKAVIQPWGICVTKVEVEEVEEDDTTDPRSWMQQFRSKRWGISCHWGQSVYNSLHWLSED